MLFERHLFVTVFFFFNRISECASVSISTTTNQTVFTNKSTTSKQSNKNRILLGRFCAPLHCENLRCSDRDFDVKHKCIALRLAASRGQLGIVSGTVAVLNADNVVGRHQSRSGRRYGQQAKRVHGCCSNGDHRRGNFELGFLLFLLFLKSLTFSRNKWTMERTSGILRGQVVNGDLGS